MCTVSYIYQGNQDFILTSNRDEKLSRALNSQMESEQIDEQNLVFPRDPEAGGTWVGSSSEGKAACLLNGAFEPYLQEDSYRISRGLMVKDFLSSKSLNDTALSYNLEGIAPFTLILVDFSEQLNLQVLRWDGKNRDLQNLDPSTSHIWSSVNLYSKAVQVKRENWFSTFLKEANISAKSVRRFHETAGDGDKENNMIMQRPDGKQTVSITQLVKKNDRMEWQHHNLVYKHQSVKTHELEKIQTNA